MPSLKHLLALGTAAALVAADAILQPLPYGLAGKDGNVIPGTFVDIRIGYDKYQELKDMPKGVAKSIVGIDPNSNIGTLKQEFYVQTAIERLDCGLYGSGKGPDDKMTFSFEPVRQGRNKGRVQINQCACHKDHMLLCTVAGQEGAEHVKEPICNPEGNGESPGLSDTERQKCMFSPQSVVSIGT